MLGIPLEYEDDSLLLAHFGENPTHFQQGVGICFPPCDLTLEWAAMLDFTSIS